jgi:hypothetical protein
MQNKHFFNYRDDQKRAASFLGHNPPDREGVRLFCTRQVHDICIFSLLHATCLFCYFFLLFLCQIDILSVNFQMIHIGP